MLWSLATGTFYLTWAVVGANLHLGVGGDLFLIQDEAWGWPLVSLAGIPLPFATLLARLVGKLHGRLAKHLLAKA